MGLKINKDKLFNLLDYCTNIAAFTGVGYLCGRSINYVVHISHPSLFPKPAFMDLRGTSALCAIFMAIDQAAQLIFEKLLEVDAKRLTFTALRLVTSFTLSHVLLQSPVAKSYKIPSLERQIAAIAISSSVLAYSILQHCLKTFNER